MNQQLNQSCGSNDGVHYEARRSSRRRSLLAVLLGAFVAMEAAALTTDQAPVKLEINNAKSVMNHPDQTSWSLFVQAAQPAATQGNNNVVFETWASDQDTFMVNPTWKSHPSALHMQRIPRFGRSLNNRAHGHLVVDALDEVRRNKPDFDYIIQNHLYDTDGLAAAFANRFNVVFPIDSIEVKGSWIPLSEIKGDASHYHINYTEEGAPYALVSMHITTKLIPNWTWATFEQEDNPGRCDDIGCRDSYGATVPVVAPQATSGLQYSGCTKSTALLSDFTKAGLEPAWQHYCLKGSQVDFVDPTGRPLLLGNSVMEGGMTNTSSCMTCHARAAFNSLGYKSSEDGSLEDAPAVLCPTGAPCSPNGSPLPDWFWNGSAATAIQTDFVWSIPYCAVLPGETHGQC